MVLAALGDTSLARGMKQVGSVSLEHWTRIFAALLSPWIIGGIVLLLGFMAAYLTALSWADLTYVLPATAFGNIITAGLARLFLHEDVTSKRWIGILLITIGVGFVAGGPALTPGQRESQAIDCQPVTAREER
jgi:drug/metabolite transporter (DMT)-like permease